MARNLFESDNQELPKRQPKDLFENSSQPDERFLDKLPRNIVAGLAQGGHELLNTPHNLVNNLEQQGQQFGQSINKALPLEKYGVKLPQTNISVANSIPYQEEHNFAQMLGQKGEPTWADTAIQKGAQYAPETLLGIKAIKDVLPHLTQKSASRSLREAYQLGIDRDMNALNVNPESIEDLRQFLPNTTPYRNLVNEAHDSIGKVNANEANIPIEKYEHGNMFGVTHNSRNTLLPSNNLGMIKEGKNARVISSAVDEKNRGMGIGKELYKEAMRDAEKKGLGFESDSVVSDDAMRVYKSLEKEGYKFEYNPHVETKTIDGKQVTQSLNQTDPVIKLISKPAQKVKPNNYQKLFDLQSDVGKHAADYAKSWISAADRAHGRAGLQARNALLEDMHRALKENGHGDISDLLRKGQEEYRRYSKFKPYRNAIAGAGIGALGAYAIPKNALTNLIYKLATMNH